MKKIMTALLGVLLSTSLIMAKEPAPFESEYGTITFSVDGTTKGEEKLIYADYGRKRVTISDTKMNPTGEMAKMMGMFKNNPAVAAQFNKRTHSMSIVNPDLDKDGKAYVYTIDLIKKTGNKISNTMTNGKSKQQMQLFSEEILKSMDFEKDGNTKEIAKEECTVWKGSGAMNGHVCIRKGITYEAKFNLMGVGGSHIVATEISSDKPDPKVFMIPDDIDMNKKTLDPAEMMKRIQQGDMQYLEQFKTK